MGDAPPGVQTARCKRAGRRGTVSFRRTQRLRPRARSPGCHAGWGDREALRTALQRGGPPENPMRKRENSVRLYNWGFEKGPCHLCGMGKGLSLRTTGPESVPGQMAVETDQR